LTETYTYDAFGTLTSIQVLNKNGVLEAAETALSRFLYAGEQYDSITELYYLRARHYDTTAGRFTQEDTYLGDGRNLYVYVGNNPLKYVDPSGYAAVDSLDSGADMDPMDDQKSITPSGGGDYNSRGANSGIQSGTTSGVTNGKCSGSKGFSFKGSSGVSTGRSSGLNSKVSISALRGKLRVSPPATVKSVKTTFGNTVSSVKSGSSTTTVGRWMSQGEYDKMFSSGKVQMSGDNKVHVASPADINVFGKQAPKGSLYVEFDVPSSTISKGGAEGWGIINGPGSLLDRLYEKIGLPRIIEMPDATNISIKGSK